MNMDRNTVSRPLASSSRSWRISSLIWAEQETSRVERITLLQSREGVAQTAAGWISLLRGNNGSLSREVKSVQPGRRMPEAAAQDVGRYRFEARL